MKITSYSKGVIADIALKPGFNSKPEMLVDNIFKLIVKQANRYIK